MGYRVFISHGWADRWVAAQIERRIRLDSQADTFLDVKDVEKGDDIEHRVFQGMQQSDELIVLLTPWSVDRNWVWVEMGAARMLGKRIVAVLYQVSLDTIDKEKGGLTFLKSKNVVDINELEAYFLELKKRAGGTENV
jgi:hypothetical protein